MKVARILFISIVLILSGFTSDNPYSPAALLSKDDCIADLQFYRTKLEQHHANLYLYTPKKEFDRFFDSLIGSVKSSMNQIEFYNLITLVNSKTQDGHTQIFPSAESMAWHNSNDRFFPFQIFWSGKQMHVIYVFNNNPKIKPGAELLSLNGKPVAEIMQFMLQRQIHDGQNQTYPAWILNNWFSSYYSFHYGNPETFSILFRGQNGKIDSVSVPAL